MSSMNTSRIGCIIPLYISPTSSLWDRVISAKLSNSNVPVAVIIDPGVTTTSTVQPAYTTLINRLNNNGIITLGYVSTNFGNDSEATVQGLIDAWDNLYPNTDGIYFAQMSNQTTKQTYYTNLDNYAKTGGFTTTVGGAGAEVPTAFLNGATVDTVVMYEGAGVPEPANYSEYSAVPNSNLGFICFGIAALNQAWISQIEPLGHWIYLTSDSGTAPFDSLPSYFESMIEYLNDVATGEPTPVAEVDRFGISKIYQTKAGGQEWFVNMSDPDSDSRFQDYGGLRSTSDGAWENTGSGDVRYEAWSPALSNDTDRLNARWLNMEITVYFKQTVGGLSYAIQLYGRGGHHRNAVQCEGSGLKARLMEDGRCRFVKEVCHPAYADNRIQRTMGNATSGYTGYTSVAGGAGRTVTDTWIGIKHVIYNVTLSGTLTTKQEMWLDRNVGGTGALVIRNQWVKVCDYVDDGQWYANQADFDANCDGCGRTRNARLTAPGGNTSSGEANYHRNCATLRWDEDGGTQQVGRWKYFSVRELAMPPQLIFGSTPPPPPDPEDPGEPASVFDNFGTRKVYPTESGGSQWYMNRTSFTNDARIIGNANTFTRNADGSWKCRNTAVTIQVAQPNGYNAGTTATRAQNHSTLYQLGVMQDIDDWRNIEMTIYFRVNSTPGLGFFDLFARGGRHITPQPNCEGSAMHAMLGTDGSSRFAKEQWHLIQFPTSLINQIGQSLLGKWIGLKYIVYNKLNQDVTAGVSVKQEMWVDLLNDNTWIKVNEMTDAGINWGDAAETCDGWPAMPIIWGGPLATFSWSTFTDVDFDKMSIREIQSDAIPVTPPPDPGDGSCGSP